MANYQVPGRKTDNDQLPAGELGKDPAPAVGKGAKFGTREWARWMWRQLTSMRVALILLLILAVAALPGAFFPQRDSSPLQVREYFESHPDLAPVLDRLFLFDVYSSPWFTAIYLLLFISLVGCIIPRASVHARAWRQPPGLVPRKFNRFPVKVMIRTDASPAQVQQQVWDNLPRVWRRRQEEEVNGALTISAERGYGRELGNIVFHLALVLVLITVAWGSLVHYRGQAVVVQGSSFVNSVLDYDSFESGTWHTEAAMEPFRVSLEDFYAEFTADGQARDFEATVQVSRPEGEEFTGQIRVNEPLNVAGTKIYLQGNGYAPEFTIHDKDGEVAFAGPVMFLPQDDMYISTGVIHVPDANQGQEQWGFQGSLLPTAIPSDDGAYAGSAHPLPLDPVVTLTMYTGDLGLDQGYATNLWTLNTEGLEQVMKTNDDGDEVAYRVVLRPGEKVELPDGGSIEMGDIKRFVALDLRYDPSIPWMGVAAVAALIGLIGSLFIPRRRFWLRTIASTDEPGTTIVYAAALSRGDDENLAGDFERILSVLKREEA